MGITASYIPSLFHDRWLSDESYYKLHAFLVDLVFADYESDIRYGLELTGGSNLIDPIGLLHYPGADDSFFAGGDAHAGIVFSFGDIEWIPALRYTILFPDIGRPDYPRMEIIGGSRLDYKKKVSIVFDGGVGINMFAGEDDPVTQLEFLWSLQLMATY